MTTYRSKIDFIFIFIFAVPMLYAFYAVTGFNNFEVNQDKIIVLVVLVVTVIVTIFGFSSLRYEISNENVTIKMLFYKKVIPVKNIRKVTKKTSMISSPALSFKRIVLHHSTGEVQISPQKQQEFLQAINHKISNSI